MCNRLSLVFIFCNCLFLACSEKIDMPSSGYATGYLSKCGIGVRKPAMIRKHLLKKLTISSLGDTGGIFAKRKLYTYFGVKNLVNDSQIDFKNKPTFIFTPGYLDLGINTYLWQSISVYYKNLGYNVLILDLSTFSIMEYPKVVRILKPLSFHIAEMISNMTSIGLNPKNLTILGISLGGQTISLVAKNYRKLTGQTIAHLIALDPAGPCHRSEGPEDRIDRTDADFVEIINTNIDGFGFGPAVGHVNFYINGGEYQPVDFAFWLPCDIICSHVKVATFWVAAMENPNGFVGIQCKSVQEARQRDCFKNVPMITNLMGPKTDKSKEGIYFVATTNKYPYFLGKKGMKKENDFVDKEFDLVTNEDLMIF